jgi:hypothetical protein
MLKGVGSESDSDSVTPTLVGKKNIQIKDKYLRYRLKSVLWKP